MAAALAVPAAVSAASADPNLVASASSAFAPDDELILEVRTAADVLSDGVQAFRKNDRVYAPLGEMARILELAITVDPAAARADGWFLAENRGFRLDVGGRTAMVAGRSRPFGADEVVVHDGEIYVDTALLQAWFPLAVDADVPNLELRLTPRETFPFEAKMARARLGKRLGRTAAPPVRGEREPTPFALFTPPSVDLTARAAYGADTDPFEYQVRASGDLLFMNASLFARGTDRRPLEDVRLLLERKDPDGGMPLGATHLAFGDVYSTGLALGPRADAGRGVYVTNRPLSDASLFSVTDIRGDVGQGYDVELFRNGLLIGLQREVDGQFAFLDVPTVYGANDFRLVFHGPRGERREETRRIQVGDGRVPVGEVRYAASVLQRRQSLLGLGAEASGRGADPGGVQSLLQVEYGLSSFATVSAGGAASVDDDGVFTGLATAGLRTGLAGLAVAGDVAVASGGGGAARVGAAGEAAGASFAFSHAEYAGGFRDENRQDPYQAYRRATDLRIDRVFRLGKGPQGGAVSVSLAASREERADGLVQNDAMLRASTLLGRWNVSNQLHYRHDSGVGATHQQLRGALEASSPVAGGLVRGRIEYAPGSDSVIEGVGVSLDRRIDAATWARVGVSHSFDGYGGTSVAASVTREFGDFDLTADGRYDPDRGLAVGLRVSTSIGWSPTRRSWMRARPGLARSGAVEALVFHDRNGDGLRQAGEPAVEQATASSAGLTARTDRRGTALLTGLPEARPSVVQVSGGLLDDPYIAASRPAIEVLPRPGRIHVASFPLTTVGEVEGRIAAMDGRPVAGLDLVLLDEAGRTVGSAKTEYDGTFVFSRIRPGAYRAVLAPEAAARARLALAGPSPVITIGANGGLVSGGDLQVVPVLATAGAELDENAPAA